MPAYTRGKKRENLVFVLVNQFVHFGFKSKDLNSLPGVSSADITALGHVALNENMVKIIGANAPKPPRVRKKLSNASNAQQQSISTFCAYDKLATVLNAGWNLSKGGKSVILRRANATSRSITAIALLSDFSHYAFPMNKADFDEFGAALGLESAAYITSAITRARLVSGSSDPYPGRAGRVLNDGSTFTSFFSTSKFSELANAGFDIVSEEKVTNTVPF